MAAKKNIEFNSTTTFVVSEEPKEKEPTVEILLEKLPGGGDGVKVDQYEHVTIANEEHEKCYKVLRGERVEIPISVYIAMKEKYPKL